jgi:hypothetical protein
MELIGWFVIVPLSLAALLTGLVQSLGTEWGLFRYYWVVVKFVLTVGAITILLLHMPAVSRMSGAVAEVIHAGGGVLLLATATTLSVYKPWGRTQHGRRKHHEWHKGVATDPADANSAERRRHEVTVSTRWGLYILLATLVLVAVFVALHLSGGGHHGH